MFTMLSGIRLNSSNRPYLGTISSNLSSPGSYNRGGPASLRHIPLSVTNAANANHSVSNQFGSPGGASCSSGSSSQVVRRARSSPATPNGSTANTAGSGNAAPSTSGGKVQVLEIVLDKETKPVFEPGDEVTGKLVLKCTGGQLRFKSLSVTMRGLAKAHWTENRTTGNRLGAYSQQYNAEIEYFNKKKFLIGALESGDRHALSEGLHEFHFRFQLPTSDEMPTSFEGRFGSVRYFVKADLDQSWAFTHRTKRAFTVISPIDINQEDYLIPVIREDEKTICCGICAAGEVQMTVATDRRGYCPGESVAIDATFTNLSTRRLVPEAVLTQTQTFSAGGKTRIKRTKFTALTGRAIQGGRDETWDAQLLKIPPVSPTITNCALVKVEYTIKVSLIIPGSYSLSVLLPIIIGTVPHRRLPAIPSTQPLPLQLTQPLISSEQPYLEDSSSSIDPAPPYQDNDPPPSYVECVGTSEEEDSSGGTGELGGEADLREMGDVSESASLYGDTRFVPIYRYVTDYQYQAPPAYSEIDPFPTDTSQGFSLRQSWQIALFR